MKSKSTRWVVPSCLTGNLGQPMYNMYDIQIPNQLYIVFIRNAEKRAFQIDYISPLYNHFMLFYDFIRSC